MTPVNMVYCTSLSRLVLIEHSIELFVLALMQPREFLQVRLYLLCFYGCFYQYGGAG